MKSNSFAVAIVFILSAAALAKGEYPGGSGAAVKEWKPKPFEAIKDGFQPIAVYIYDSGPKTNGMSKAMEGKDGLESDAVKGKLEKFAKIKIKADGSDAKNWPDAWREEAKGGACLLLMSADHTLMLHFNKDTPGGTKGRSKDAIAAGAEEILAYEAKKKAEALKHEKAEEAVVAKAEKEKPPAEAVKPLIGLEDKPKVAVKDPKKAGDAKPTDAKKAADPKAPEQKKPDPKVADAKGTDKPTATDKDPKKMKRGPEDE